MEDVQRPTRAIKALYAAQSTDAGDDFGVEKHFSELLASGAKVRSHESLNFVERTHLTDACIIIFSLQIPILTSETTDLIPNNSLVRIRGMVGCHLVNRNPCNFQIFLSSQPFNSL